MKTLPVDHYLPAMLASLVAPGEVQTRVIPNRYGRLVFEQAFVYEGSDRKVVSVLDNAYRYGVISGQIDDGQGILAVNAVGSVNSAQTAIAVQAFNRILQRLNRRIIDTLRYVTGKQLAYDPKAWWQWWNDYNETVIQGQKPTAYCYSRQESLVSVAGPSVPVGPMAPLGSPGYFASPMDRLHSCLIAGTPIWTDRGAVAIETMRVGDRVLAQDTVSGELAYKPVLRTTVRPRSPLIHIALAEETIVASGGHPFWVSGKGWVNARHLEPGMFIHTVTGTTPVNKVDIEEDGRQPVYNLVVEDFHNYFAGNAHLLLHDITPREPTLGPVPGFQDTNR